MFSAKWCCRLPCEYLSDTEGGVRVFVRLVPKASSDRIVGVAAEADGGSALKVAVTAVPEDGKANARLVSFLAKSLKLAKTDIAIVSGATQRRKVLLVRGDAKDVRRRFAATVREP